MLSDYGVRLQHGLNNKLMKKKIVYLLLFLCFFKYLCSAWYVNSQRKVAYMDIKSYRYHKMNVNHAIDSIGFKIIKMTLSSQW
jgi:hypothetical protein